MRRIRDLFAGGRDRIHVFFSGTDTRPPFFDRRDWTLILGLLFLARGLGEVFPPAAAIAVGGILVAAALGFSFTKGGA